MRFFICPNCTTRALDDDGKAGLTHQPVGCEKCGFGYLFELLEDFFPPAGAGMGCMAALDAERWLGHSEAPPETAATRA